MKVMHLESVLSITTERILEVVLEGGFDRWTWICMFGHSGLLELPFTHTERLRQSTGYIAG